MHPRVPIPTTESACYHATDRYAFDHRVANVQSASSRSALPADQRTDDASLVNCTKW